MTAWEPFAKPIAVPTSFRVPEPWRQTGTGKCRSCREPIAWAQHPHTGSKQPFDADGRRHMETCANSDFWRERAQAREGASR